MEKLKTAAFLLFVSIGSSLIYGCRSVLVIPQSNPGGEAVSYGAAFSELPEGVRPNDATISLYEERKHLLIETRKSQGRIYSIQPKGNAVQYAENASAVSEALQQQLAHGYILSYIFYDKGTLRFNGVAEDGRFARNITDQTLFYTHSSGKSIVSYIVGHAICEGYINSVDEVIDWPLMSQTLYQGQYLRDLLNMSAGDSHVVDERTTRVMGSKIHHRDLGLDTIASSLKGTKKKGSQLFYNNFLSDVIANYLVFRVGDHYDEFMRKIFQDKIKIEHEVLYEKHARTFVDGEVSPYYGQLQTQASYSFFITRMDFLRLAEAMMKDYQSQNCVGKYLKMLQNQARPWPKYRPNKENANLWLHNYAKKYGGQFYFDFQGLDQRNILASEGYNGQNIMIDMDNSRILITNSAATAWDQNIFILDVMRSGKLPK
jgi:CubicO group peptidase (beta-lactamase class C family)